MDILLYSIIYPPDVCSNAYVFADLTDEFIRRGHRVTVITTTPHFGGSPEGLRRGKKNWYQVSNFHGAQVFHICVGSEKGGVLRHLDTYARFHYFAGRLLHIEPISADVIIAQTPPPITVGYTTRRLGKRLNAKTVLILQDIWVDNLHNRKRIGNAGYAILNRIERSVYGKMDGVVTLSEEMAETIGRKLECKDRLHIIPNPVNTELYFPRKKTAELCEKYDVREDEFVISYVGNLSGAQDLRPLFSYAKSNPNVKVLIAGNGRSEKEYREMAADCDRIVFLGYISREETTEVNAVSDVCLVMLAGYISGNCLPSKLPTLLAMGKPIALCCAADCGLTNYVMDNSVGLAADVNRADSFAQMMERLRQDKTLRDVCADNSYRVAMRDFSLHSIGDRYEALMQEICD